MSIFRQRTRSLPPREPELEHPPKHQGKLGFSDVARMFIRLRRFSLRAGVGKPTADPTSPTDETPTSPKSPSKSFLYSHFSHESNHATPVTQSGRDSPIVISSPPTQGTSSPPRIKIRKSSGSWSTTSSGATTPGSPYARHTKPWKAAADKPHHIVSSSGEEPRTHPLLQSEISSAMLQDLGVMEGSSANTIPFASSGDDASDDNTQWAPVECYDTYDCMGGVNLLHLLRATRSTILEYVKSLPGGPNVLVEEKWQSSICGPKHGVYRVQICYAATPKRSHKPDPKRPVAIDQAKGVQGVMTILKRNTP